MNKITEHIYVYGGAKIFTIQQKQVLFCVCFVVLSVGGCGDCQKKTKMRQKQKKRNNKMYNKIDNQGTGHANVYFKLIQTAAPSVCILLCFLFVLCLLFLFLVSVCCQKNIKLLQQKKNNKNKKYMRFFKSNHPQMLHLTTLLSVIYLHICFFNAVFFYIFFVFFFFEKKLAKSQNMC